VRLVDVSTSTILGVTARLVAEIPRTSGARREAVESCARDAPSIMGALKGRPADLIVLVGGTGQGGPTRRQRPSLTAPR
jgi:hypothetical protein